MPNIRDKKIERAIRKDELFSTMLQKYISYVYQRSMDLTDAIRQAQAMQGGVHFALITGLNGYATSWICLRSFCEEEEPFWMLIRALLRVTGPHHNL